MTDKREHISKLSVDGLVEMLERLLPSMGIKDVKRVSGNAIEATIDAGPAGTFTNCYILMSEHLTKSYAETDSLAEFISKRFSAGCSKAYVVNNGSISGGFELELEKRLTKKNSTLYWKLDDILTKIDDHYPDYWRHSDKSLVSYETDFEQKINESFEIKKLVEFKAAYQKLLSIFIEPNLFLRTEDKQSTRKAFTRISLDRLIDENERILMLHGDPGVGKTRLLNEIGRHIIKRNTAVSGKRFLPVFIDSINIRDSFIEKDGGICKMLLESRLNNFFEGLNLQSLLSEYKLVLLIDSIDEFEDSLQQKITKELEELMDKGVLVFLATRANTLESLFKTKDNKKFKDVFIQKFNDAQVEKFTSRYFEGKGNRAQSLIESMKENKILEKLPLTPLNLSLMSILYEETNNEIPATLTDIYDKFSNLLLGRTMVEKRIDFLDITVKENILGIYALELISRKNSELMTKDEFIDFFKDKLSSVSGTIKLEMLPQALDYIIEHTGLLILYKSRYIKFRHDSYMEYFAAKEIFKNHRELEKELVTNFFDVNWQYAAIFYAGMSRKMPDFLEQVIKKITTSSNMKEYWAATNGMGYLLQALYLTDDNIRKRGVKETLKIMVEAFECFKKISSSLPQNVLFSRIPLPVLSIFPIFLFQDNFDSATLRKPLSLALDELLVEYEEKRNVSDYPYLDNIIYRILILSVTMSSDRLNMEDKLIEVIDKVKTTGNEFYTKLLESAIDNLGSRELRKQRNEILKPVRVRRTPNHPYFLKQELDVYLQPASRQRFGKHDKITPNKRVKIFVEGPSDAILIEHAYTVLTKHMPYWEIKVGDPTGGGANGLAKALNEGLAYLEEDQLVIGIFDNDREGIPQFKGTLHESKFDRVKDYDRIKKRKQGNIYGMLLPIPEQMQHYIQSNQTDNYFSIEHYLPKNYLEENQMLVETAIPGIQKIKDTSSSKVDFAKETAKLKSIELFTGFIILLKEIDRLAGLLGEIHYSE